jgi:hypothetical protein
LEKAYVALHLPRHEANKLADGVPLLIAYLLKHSRGVVNVAHYVPDTCRHVALTVATVQQPQVMPAGSQLACDGTTDGARTTYY